MNKINHFEGDNDNVDEELESSTEKVSQHSSEDEQSKEEKLFEATPDKLQSSQNKNEQIFNMTYGADSNLLSSGRGDTRILSDLSSKVVNINGEGVINQNPFSVQH